MDQFLKYTHTNPSEDTISKFFNNNKGYTQNLSLTDFVLYDGGTGSSNMTRIFGDYPEEFKQNYNSFYRFITESQVDLVRGRETEIGDLPLEQNTELLIPTSKFNNELISVKGKNLFVDQRNINGFWSDKLTQLLKDPDYVPSENLVTDESRFSVELINQNIQIWVWCRALDKIIDVSPFVSQANISKSEVGSFSVTLNPIKDIFDYYDIENSDIINYFNLRDNDGSTRMDFFHSNFQQNDVVFIKFEKLKLERIGIYKPFFSFEIDKSELPGQVWDMIGLLDTNSSSSTDSSVDYEVSLSGRDFLKLLIEDGSYILPVVYLVGGKDSIIFGFNKDDKFFKRMYAGGENFGTGMYEFTISKRNIADSVGFIVNQLSNLGVLGGSDLFSQYGSRRTQSYSITGEGKRAKTQLVDGVWQIVKFFIDSQLDSRIVVDASLSQSDGTLMEQFNKLCQQPFVEIFGDTYGDEFNFVIRQPPFNKEGVMSFLKGTWETSSSLDKSIPESIKSTRTTVPTIIEISEDEISKKDLDWDETYYSWYRVDPIEGLLAEYANIATGGVIPIIYFTQIAETLGNHRKIVQDNYLDVQLFDNVNYQSDKNVYRNELLKDLKFIIDTNVYLPFTRKGSIVLNKGDRRIKRGTFIRLKQTGEIFYVDSVSNSISFYSNMDRQTSMQVSRGMIEEYIDGYKGWDQYGQVITKNDQAVRFSYFSIINTNLLIKNISSTGDQLDTVNDITKSEESFEYNVTIPESSTIAFNNKNPGNLTYAGQPNAMKGSFRVVYDVDTQKTSIVYWANFDTKENGFKAVISQINKDADVKHQGLNSLTISQFVHKYAPAKDNNNEVTYVNFICSQLNTASFVKISSLDSFKLAQAIIKKESSSTVEKKSLNSEPTTKKVEKQQISKSIKVTENNMVFDEQQYNFFLKRMQLNKFKYNK